MLNLAIILLIIGLILLTVEIFMPGFGIPGVTGCICIAVASILAIIYVPFGIFIVLGGVVVLGCLFYLLFGWFKGRRSYDDLILKDTSPMEEQDFKSLESFLGKEGTTLMPLRPQGAVDFNGLRIDVFSDGAFIPKGRRVKVIDINRNKIIVKELN